MRHAGPSLAACTLAGLLTAGPAHVQDRPDRGVLLRIDHLDILEPQQITTRGRIEGAPAEIILDAGIAGPGLFSIDARLSHQPFGRVRLPLAAAPRLDLASAEYRWRRWDDGLVVRVTLAFGEGNGCFVNHDGRPMLTIDMPENRAPSASITRYGPEPEAQGGCAVSHEPLAPAP